MSARPTVLVATGCDRGHHGLAEELIQSIRATCRRTFALGFVRMDGSELPAALRAPDIIPATARDAETGAAFAGYRAAFLNVKASLPSLIPGFDIYIWLDADCWVQSDAWLEALVNGARQADVCVHPEYDVHYTGFQTPNDRTVALYLKLFDRMAAEAVWRYPMVNAGVFGARADSPLWALWSATIDDIRGRLGDDSSRQIVHSDQIPLHHLIYTRRLSLFPLRTVHNWQPILCIPGFDGPRRRLTVPTPPFEEISILHLSGDMKSRVIPCPELNRTSTLRYRDVQALFDAAAPAPV